MPAPFTGPSLWGLLCLVGLFVIIARPAPAQSPFPDCAYRTGTNASLLLPADATVRLDREAPAHPVWIAAVTNEGRCVGRVRWTGEPTALTVWGTDGDFDPGSETALAPNDTLLVQIFDPSTETHYTPANSRIVLRFRSRAPHLTHRPLYVPDGIYVVDRLLAERTLLTGER